MNIEKADLEWATGQGLIDDKQVAALWSAWQERGPQVEKTPARFDLANVLYFFGAMIVIGAMGWFMGIGWESFGGVGISGISLAYATVFVLVGRSLWNKKMTVPGGLFITMAVGMTPLFVYGLQKASGIWSNGDPGVYRDFHTWINASWFYMELGTVAAGLVALRFFRFPFLTAPIAFAMWYMSMDLAPLLAGLPDWSGVSASMVSMGVGLIMLVIAFVIDQRTTEDYAFWLYLFGMFSFWGGMVGYSYAAEIGWTMYGIINVCLMLLAPLLDRRVFVVFGGLGVSGYLGHLSWTFVDSALFPFILTFVGLGIIFAGIQFQRWSKRIDEALTRMLPEQVRQMLPRERVSRST